MTDPTRARIGLTLAAIDPPFTADHGVLFGLQGRHGVEDPVPACRTTDFVTEVEVRTGDGEVDFAGEHVHGRRGDRFVYVSWGLPDPTEPFAMFARAKIRFAHVPPDLLDVAVEQQRALRAEFDATNARGQPASGTIGPPALRWSIDSTD